MKDRRKQSHKIETNRLAFLDYYDGDNERQFAVFYRVDKDGVVYYLDVDSSNVYTLANPTGEKMQEAPCFVNHYSKRLVRFGKDDLFFREDLANPELFDGDFSANEELSVRFLSTAKTIDSFRKKVRYVYMSGKLRNREIAEDELLDLIRVVNIQEKRKAREGESFSFKEIFREKAGEMVVNFAEGLEDFEKLCEKTYGGSYSRVPDFERYSFEEDKTNKGL